MDYHTNALAEALERLSTGSFMPAIVARMGETASTANGDFQKTVLAEIPAFSESRNPRLLPDLAEHGAEQTREIMRLLRGGSVEDFAFVCDYAERRADQRFPLEATLHAYRCGHKVFAGWLRQAMLEAISSSVDARQSVASAADFAMEFTNAVSTISASAYVSQIRLLAEVAGDRRSELLAILLDGYDESDGRVAEILHDAGFLEGRQSFCVALAQSIDPAEMLNPIRARRLADAIDETLQGLSTRRLIDLRDNKVTIICSDICRVSGWTVPQIDLAGRLTAELAVVGTAALIGVSNDALSTSQIPTAHREAQLALELADVTQRVTQFSEVPMQRLILHLAGDEFQRVLPAWTGDFLAADTKGRGALVATLRAYADVDMNALRAAERLKVHPNTIYTRFQKILDITGLEARSYNALTELLLVADCGRRSSIGRIERGRAAD